MKTDKLLHPGAPVRPFSTPARDSFVRVEGLVDDGYFEAPEASEPDPLELEASEAEEFAASDVRPRDQSPIAPRGDVSALYAAYIAAMAASDGSMAAQLTVENAKGALLADVRNFALRLFSRGGNRPQLNNIAGEDIASDAVVRVLENLDKFRGQYEFSFYKWVRTITTNLIADAVRKEEMRAESPLCDETPHLETRTDADFVTTGRAGPSQDADAVTAVYEARADEGGEPNGRPVLLPGSLQANESGIVLELTQQQAIERLNPLDQRVCKLILEGRTDDEIVAELHLKNSKSAYNLVHRLREKLAHELCVLETVLHTCRLQPASVTELVRGELYVLQGENSYRQLVGCRCRKTLTDKEAAKAFERRRRCRGVPPWQRR